MASGSTRTGDRIVAAIQARARPDGQPPLRRMMAGRSRRSGASGDLSSDYAPGHPGVRLMGGHHGGEVHRRRRQGNQLQPTPAARRRLQPTGSQLAIGRACYPRGAVAGWWPCGYNREETGAGRAPATAARGAQVGRGPRATASFREGVLHRRFLVDSVVLVHMTPTTCHMSISLDGFVAGPDQSGDNPLGVGGLELHHAYGRAHP